MSIQKIKESELIENGIGSLSTRPSLPSLYEGRPLSASELRAAFDRLPRLLAERYNALLDSLGAWKEGNETLAESIATGLSEGHSLADLFTDIADGTLFTYLKNSQGISLSALLGALAAPIGEIAEGERQAVSGDTVARRLSEERTEAERRAASLYRLSHEEGENLSFCLEVMREGAWQKAGDVFSLPKDIFLKGGVVLSCTENGKPLSSLSVGDKYLDLTLGGAEERHVFIPLSDLVDRFHVIEEGEGDIITSLSSDGSTLTAKKELDSRHFLMQEDLSCLDEKYVMRDTLAHMEKKLAMLLKKSEGSQYAYETDDDISCCKPIPSGASGYALLERLGGMSYSDNLFDPRAINLSANGFSMRYDPDDACLVLNGTLSSDSSSFALCHLPAPILFREKRLFFTYEGRGGSMTAKGASAWIGFYAGFLGGMPDHEASSAQLPLNGQVGAAATHPNNDAVSDHVDSLIVYVTAPENGASLSVTFTDYRIRIMINEGDKSLPFIPFGLHHTVNTALTVIGKNCLPSEAKSAQSWARIPSPNGYLNGVYDLHLPNGWYVMSAKLRESYAADTYLYLQKSSNGGLSYSSTSVGYNKSGESDMGYFVTDKGLYVAPIWFKVTENNCFRLLCYNVSQSRLDNLYDWQIERVELANDPSASYKPKDHAPPTAYEPYTEHSLSIPDPVLALDGFGMGISDSLFNEWDISGGKYIKRVGERGYITGDENDESVITDGERTVYPLESEIVTDVSSLAFDPFLKVKENGTVRFETAWHKEIPSAVHYQISLTEGAEA